MNQFIIDSRMNGSHELFLKICRGCMLQTPLERHANFQICKKKVIFTFQHVRKQSLAHPNAAKLATL